MTIEALWESLSPITRLGGLYILILSFITFFFFGFDKWQSTSNSRRVRERTLWILSLLGGSAGALIAMHVFRHKTKKISFQAVLAIILALQLLLITFIGEWL